MAGCYSGGPVGPHPTMDLGYSAMTNLFISCFIVFLAGQMLSFFIEGQIGLATTQLTAAVSNSTTTIPVNSTDGFRSRDFIIIGNEHICYSGMTATSFTGATRGCQKTDADSHPATDVNGPTIVYNPTTGLVNRFAAFRVVQTFADDGLVKGFITFFSSLGSIAKDIATMLSWDYSYLDGMAVYVKYFFLYPITAGMALALTQLVFRRGN